MTKSKKVTIVGLRRTIASLWDQQAQIQSELTNLKWRAEQLEQRQKLAELILADKKLEAVALALNPPMTCGTISNRITVWQDGKTKTWVKD